MVTGLFAPLLGFLLVSICVLVLLVAIVLGAVFLCLVATAVLLSRFKGKQRQADDGERTAKSWNHERLTTLLRSGKHTMPCGIVNVDVFDRNTDYFMQVAASHGKRLRIATKSVRVPELVRRAAERHPDTVIGVMCFSVAEVALYAVHASTRNILLAYPLVQPAELQQLWQAGMVQRQAVLTQMVDCGEHVRLIGMCWLQNAHRTLQEQVYRPVMARLCIDVDVAFAPLPIVYIGSHRSPCRTPGDIDDILNQVAAVNSCWEAVWKDGVAPTASLLAQHAVRMKAMPWSEKTSLLRGPLVTVTSVMGYEAHIAGVPDASGWTPARNIAVRFMKWWSVGDVKHKRAELCAHLQERGIDLEFVNGGGTGSILSTIQDERVTEVAVGSGLLQSHIFDFFTENSAEPALVFALAVTRKSHTCGSEIVTCQSGGFIASGEVGRDKTPSVFLPSGYREFSTEGFGEVQTPLCKLSPSAPSLSVGDYVFLRPAKAGEIAERFSKYLLVHDNEDGVEEALTYRGLAITAY
ncbi:uncharacterized protein LOC135823522 [Sycon ciliatum]|uniref:uncharacterized protein LOC135823522 n=1 Tax=Sycon ciliatum TaxID=27933 RepID=UPI0031F6610A